MSAPSPEKLNGSTMQETIELQRKHIELLNDLLCESKMKIASLRNLIRCLGVDPDTLKFPEVSDDAR